MPSLSPISSLVPAPKKEAFSLVEVVIALGIVSFCILAIIGTLSAGYQGNRSALASGDAARTLGIVASSLRSASVTNSTITSSAPFKFSWTVGGSSTNYSSLWTEGNTVTNAVSAARQRVDVALLPPSATNSVTSAAIVVAWPASAQITWSGQNATVTNAEGYDILYVYVNAQ